MVDTAISSCNWPQRDPPRDANQPIGTVNLPGNRGSFPVFIEPQG